MDFNRRQFLMSSVATFAVASLSTPLMAAEPIVIGVPTAKSGPVGVADQADWLNGVTMAVEEINAAGGVMGRVAKMGDSYLHIEVANNVELQVQRPSVVQVLPKGTFK